MKFDIIGRGLEFFDKTGAGGCDTLGVRINGTCVERLSTSGKWFTASNVGEPIKELIWEKNGSVHALTEAGYVKYATVLPPDANAGYVAKKVNLKTLDEYRLDQSAGREGKTKLGKKRVPLWKWPFKFLWWCVKLLARLLFLGFLLDAADNNK